MDKRRVRPGKEIGGEGTEEEEMAGEGEERREEEGGQEGREKGEREGNLTPTVISKSRCLWSQCLRFGRPC